MPAQNSKPADLPEGFAYRPEFLTNEEDAALLRKLRDLPFHAFDFHGYLARRRLVEYGFEYDFSSRQASITEPIPDFLRTFQERAAAWALLDVSEIVEAVITEYSEGTPIGWHRDIPRFEEIIGISLNASCRMRFKPYRADGNITSIVLEPRSAYVMRGPVRWNFQHSIPPVKALRYSITFRTARRKVTARLKKPDRAVRSL